MEQWQLALILLAVLWALQAVGTWAQMRHYRALMARIARSWPDGFVGAGNARSKLGKGVIAIVVVSQDLVIRTVALMEGRSVLATFEALPDLEGLALDAARERLVDTPNASARLEAFDRAVEQINKIRSGSSSQNERQGASAAA